ncbi:hypothetical protein PR002_g11529 [Phytophthora rubi]|uniref:CCHC-type domain-containing protein n=1 Tax=Phytophthora rubi TaxID=129364 RepID=A0A6A3LY94_9STRA|nr:hypothetical protein PR002_g11529 [Phytophthora rubi]
MPSTEGVPVGSSTTQPPVSEQTVLMQIMQKMMAVQQQVMQQQQLQFQAFLEHQACVRNDIFEKQARASRQISKAEPPKFNGTAKEELELWLFQIEEHFSGYAAERDSNDSRFVDLVVPYLGTDVMSWYREFKHTLGETPRTWCGFMQQFRVRFRDSDFEYKLLSRVYDLQATGTQQEYTAKFMLLLSQSSLDLPEMVKRWFTSRICGQIPARTSRKMCLQLCRRPSAMPNASRMLESRRRLRTRRLVINLLVAAGTANRLQLQTTRKRASSLDPEVLKNAICHICGVKGHIAPDCSDKGKPRAAKPR